MLHDVPAPAKLNLFLHVVGRRDDGYHLLQSVFALIDWCDTLHFERRDDGLLRRHDLTAALPEDDLSLRAARLLQRESGCRLGADISIDKQVPWGAGLGGGSSDAASTLLALNRLWAIDWPRERLLALAARLGADVPFFVGGRNAWVEGIGDRLTPIDLAPRWWAVLKPAVAVPTAAIFGSPTLVRNTAAATISSFLADPPGFGHNDLQGPAMAYSDEVAEALTLLQTRFGNGRMTGSGSAVFAEAGTGDAPRFGMTEAGALPPGWMGRMCRGLERHPLADWAG
ncbi:4-(cytidine 5'-diphospho)-2-C-methyl-D-erythritol kinase [uncultured Methylibium sp.]|uniref:4-(cytidine 5'-diphospho)-2-C-methyl-D-erythritol kinase n=1 Tax=uncultured Methylibium sp. TaxID=381093 RepID=UPI0025D2F342|nr:4-(cytidine 5'-diphospho)-2-C-methyl-D-erythritol kinase [uncultured Methylibium sp.]